MGDPTRLLSASSDADALERELLESLRTGPEGEQRAAMWRGVAGQLAAAGVVAGVSSVAASSATAAVAGKASSQGLLAGAAALLPKALAAKVAVLVAVGAAGVGGYAALHTPTPPVQSVPVPTATHEQTAARQPSIIEPTAPAQPAVSEVRAQPQPRARARSEQAKPDALAAESRLLTEARARLRAGDSAGAQRALRTLQVRFAHGVLVQEREVLHIELLVQQGKGAEAGRRARAFVQAYPDSPHGQSLQRLLGTP